MAILKNRARQKLSDSLESPKLLSCRFFQNRQKYARPTLDEASRAIPRQPKDAAGESTQTSSLETEDGSAPPAKLNIYILMKSKSNVENSLVGVEPDFGSKAGRSANAKVAAQQKLECFNSKYWRAVRRTAANSLIKTSNDAVAATLAVFAELQAEGGRRRRLALT